MDFVWEILYPALLGRVNLETDPRINHRYFVLSSCLMIIKRTVCYIQHFTDELLPHNEAVS